MNGLRRITQLAGLFLGNGYLKVLSTGYLYQGPLKGLCLPFMSCYACPLAIFSCPIGTLQHFAAIRVFPFLLLGMLGLFGLVLGRFGCGWLCPFGLLQDLMYRIPSRKYRIPEPLFGFKYLVLILAVVFIPYLTGAPWFSKLCPWGTLTAGLPWVLADPRDPATAQPIIAAGEAGFLFALKLAILGVFLTLFVATKRPFCRTTCPLGALFSLFNRLSVVRLKVALGCRQCGSCRARCPVDLQVSREPNSPECIRCLSCTACKNVQVELTPIGLLQRPALYEDIRS